MTTVLAQYSGDCSMYEAKIRHIYKNEQGHMMALVSYLGYTSDNDEEKQCSDLKRIAKPKKKKTLPKKQHLVFILI